MRCDYSTDHTTRTSLTTPSRSHAHTPTHTHTHIRTHTRARAYDYRHHRMQAFEDRDILENDIAMKKKVSAALIERRKAIEDMLSGSGSGSIIGPSSSPSSSSPSSSSATTPQGALLFTLPCTHNTQARASLSRDVLTYASHLYCCPRAHTHTHTLTSSLSRLLAHLLAH